MPNCEACGKVISRKEMKKDVMGLIWEGTPFADKMKYMPNVMEGLAMKCNRCGIWICAKCAEKTAMSAGAGMIQHSDCGGMFETPK